MTAQEIFNRTIGTMGMLASNATTYQTPFPQQLNTVLAETFKIENGLREFKGLTRLTSIPVVTALTDTVDYQEDMLLMLSYGCAMYLSLSDDDTVKAQFFNQQYLTAQASERRVIYGEIVDYFGDEEE